jgi:hypothetical protein
MSGSYDDSFRQEMVGVMDEVFSGLQADGLVPREDAVRLAYVTRAGEDRAAGEPGAEDVEYTTIEPRPKVDPRAQWRVIDGATVLVGDALLKISRSVTEEALTTADWVEVGGEAFTLVAGRLKKGAFFWEAVVNLKR